MITIEEIEKMLPDGARILTPSVRAECIIGKAKFTIYVSSDKGFYFKAKGKKWRFVSGLNNIHKEVAALQDKNSVKRGKALDEGERNKLLLSKLIDAIEPLSTVIKPDHTYEVGKDMHLFIDKDTNKVKVHYKVMVQYKEWNSLPRYRKTSHLRPAIAIDRMANFDPALAVLIKENDAGGVVAKRISKALKRRGERAEAAEGVLKAIQAVGYAAASPECQEYLVVWKVGDTLISYDAAFHKFLIYGEWRLPMAALEKLAEVEPSVAETLADPEFKL
jgi:hypothetical protein